MRIPGLKNLKWSKAPFGRAWLAPILAATVIISAGWAQWSDVIQLLENRTFDWRSRMALHFSPVVSDKIVMVTIGDDFLQRKFPVNKPFMDELLAGHRVIEAPTNGIGYPLPRAFYGEVVRRLHEQGAQRSVLTLFSPNLTRMPVRGFN